MRTLDREIVNRVRERMSRDSGLIYLSDEEFYTRIHEYVEEMIGNESRLSEMKDITNYISISDRVEIECCVADYIRGFGPLGELLRDESVTEIMANRYDEIFVERDGRMELSDVKFESVENMESIMQRIAAEDGKEINQANPMADAMLSDGSRVNMTFPPITLDGPTITIRKFPTETMTAEKLIEYGTLTEELAYILGAMVRSRYNILISGGTSSGKTSFLNAMSGYILPDERIITIEDSAELKLLGIKNYIRMTKRYENSSGTGEVTIRQLIRNALRMTPTRIIVGEVRGAEALDMLQAMNTGHDGSMSTAHANSTEAMLSRLGEMISEGNNGFSDTTIQKQIASSLDIIIQLTRDLNGNRRVAEITEVEGYDENGVKLNRLYITDEYGQLVPTGSRLKKSFKLKNAGYGEVLSFLIENDNVMQFDPVLETNCNL
ncbi:MAG: CpaF family protein [Eubacterium sp.]|nr:CpaF family protein [Eubacterium sp.]